MNFVQYVKTKNKDTVYGQLDSGQWLAFENPEEFKQFQPDFSKVQLVKDAPQATDFSQYQQSVATTGTTAPFDPTQYGITPELWATLSPADKAFAESAAGLIKSQFDSGQTNVSINQDLLNKALTAAQTDPNIISKYGDAAKTAASDISFNLGQINANYATQQSQQQLEMAQAKKDLAEQIGSAGQAYSGYRKQAENLLGAQQANIIQSTKSQLQQQVQQAGRAYETQFGSTALARQPPITAGGQSYTPVGGLAGSDPLAQKQDVLNRQSQIFSNERL